MKIVHRDKISVKQILSVVPVDLLTQLAIDTKVDYCAKVLHGKLMFYLLLYGLLKVDRLSQRGLADVYGSRLFKTLFNIEGNRRLSHSSISDRLSGIPVDFFVQCYDKLHHQLSGLYTPKEIKSFYLQRVDSTLVSEASTHLKAGLFCGNNKSSKRKMIKYSMSFDGTFASLSRMYTENLYSSEDIALPQVIGEHLKKDKHHSSIYLFDRGVQSAEVFKKLETDHVFFVGRLLDNRRLKIVEDLTPGKENCRITPDKTLLLDCRAKLYKKVTVVNKSGKEVRRSELVDNIVRVIKIHVQETGKTISFITNNLELSALEISECYRRRWDIEVFFRFLKQELNFSHLISMNENGIRVMMYMTLITAMLIMIFKRMNEVGYKTARRRIGLELEELIAAIFVIKGGGDLKKAGLDDP